MASFDWHQTRVDLTQKKRNCLKKIYSYTLTWFALDHVLQNKNCWFISVPPFLATLQGSLLRGEEDELTNNVPLEEEKEHLLQGLFHHQRRRYYDTPPKPLLIKPGLRYPFLHTKSSVEKQALIVKPFRGHLFVRRRRWSM